MIEREAVKSKKIKGVLHLSDADLRRVLAQRAASTSAAQGTGTPGVGGSSAHSDAQDYSLVAARRELEQKKLAARTAEAEAELRRAQDAQASADAERQARIEEAKLAAERHRLELDRERLAFERTQERAATETRSRHAREQEAFQRERAREAREQARQAWVFEWLGATTSWVAKNFGMKYAAGARLVARGVLLDFDPSGNAKLIAASIRAALWERYGHEDDLLIDRELDQLEDERNR